MTILTSASAEAAQCRVDLKNGRGKLLQSFVYRGYDRQYACQSARRSCQRVKQARYYRAPIQRCEVAGRGQVGRQVVRSCNSTMIARRGYGRVIQRFTAQARGRRGSGVLAQACSKAKRQCQLAKARMGRRAAVCR